MQELGFKAIRVLPWLWELLPTDRASTRWTEEAIAVATKHENVYIGASAYTVKLSGSAC